MLHLLDANVLIDSARDFYQLERVPQFWDWLLRQGEEGRIAIPREIWEEFKEGTDALGAWARSDPVKKCLVFPEEPDPTLVNRVVMTGYGPDLTDEEVERLGRDPFLIAYALVEPRNRRVVTTEASRPRRRRANRHIPDVCADLGLLCFGAVDLINELDFRIG
jgi:hypothetical protein